MLFKQVHLNGIKTGSITLAFRKWKQPAVKEHSEMKTTIGVVNIGKVKTIQLSAITQKEAIAAGYLQLEDLLKLLTAVPDGEIYKIAVSYQGEDPRIALREQDTLTVDALEILRTKLNRLDQYSKTGPWTIQLLTLIKAYPKLKAADLAAKTGEEKEVLKLNVRKLKNLGLTISHDPGYTLSPLGLALLHKW